MAVQQNNSKTNSKTNTKTPNTTTTPLGIQSNISVTKKEAEYFKRFTSLNPSAEPLPQGDGVIRISPFDDYVIFTLFDETTEIKPGSTDSKAIAENPSLADSVINTADTPIDLSNVGTLTLVFVGENNEIRIPNWTQVQEVDLSQGQVLFRISKEDSKKILALDNQNFYISTRMEDESGVSDESVLYTGTFLTLQDSVQQTMTDKLNQQALLYSKELASKQKIIDDYAADLREMISLDEVQNTTIATLEASNLELANELALLTEKLGATEATIVTKNARRAAQAAETSKKKRSQIKAIQLKSTKSSGNKQLRYYSQAADLLQEFTTSKNPITPKNLLNDI